MYVPEHTGAPAVAVRVLQPLQSLHDIPHRVNGCAATRITIATAASDTRTAERGIAAVRSLTSRGTTVQSTMFLASATTSTCQLRCATCRNSNEAIHLLRWQLRRASAIVRGQGRWSGRKNAATVITTARTIAADLLSSQWCVSVLWMDQSDINLRDIRLANYGVCYCLIGSNAE